MSCSPPTRTEVLLNKLNTTVDGEFQRYSTESGDYIRDHFFGLIRACRDGRPSQRRGPRQPARSGHDYRKLYAAYKAATENLGSGAPGDPQDDQGLDTGSRHRGPQRHPPDQEDEQGPAAPPARPAVPPRRDPRVGPRRRRRPVLPPSPGLDRVPVHDGAPPGPRWFDPQARRSLPHARPLPDDALRRAAQGLGRPSRLDDDEFTRLLRNMARTRTSASTSCRSSPTRAARSAWTRCSPS